MVVLARLGISPNALTLTSLILHIPCAALLASGQLSFAAITLVVALVLDVFDGELARHLGRTSRRGDFFDSTSDQLSDVIVHVGLSVALFPEGPWAEVAVLASVASSMLSSHVRARAGMLGFDCSVGLIQRGERSIVLVAGLFLDSLLGATVVLVALNSLTASQRFIHVFRTSATVVGVMDENSAIK